MGGQLRLRRQGPCFQPSRPLARTWTSLTYGGPIDWVIAHQNEDGGWGESCGSYVDFSLRGVGVQHSVTDGMGPTWPCWPPLAVVPWTIRLLLKMARDTWRTPSKKMVHGTNPILLERGFPAMA